MQILRNDHVFQSSDNIVSYENSWGNRVHCSCVVHCMNDSFLEYQKSLCEDFFADIHEQLHEEVSYNNFRKWLEPAIQEFNIKLTTFASKIKHDEKFVLKWFIQIFIDGEYVNSLLGPVWIIILRKKKLAYMMVNDILQSSKISTFADIVEGDIKHDDVIVITGIPIETYIDADDVGNIIQQSEFHDALFLDELYELLNKRVEDKEITALYQYSIHDQVTWFGSKVSSKLLSTKNLYKKLSHFIHTHRHETMIGCVGILMTYLWYWTITWYMSQQNTSYIDQQWVEVSVSIEDIKEEIQEFDRIASDSDEKLKKYNTIQQKISILESQNKQQFDVIELKKILEMKYFKWFNTTLFASMNEFGNSLYQFSDQEKDMLWDVKNIFWKNGIFVAGDKGVLLNAINQTARGILVWAPVGKTLTKCNSNIKKDWFFCLDASYQLYNTNRQWFSQLSVVESAFPIWIQDFQTFRTTNLFALLEDKNLNAKWVYLLKYQLEPGKQDAFQKPVEYNQFVAQQTWVQEVPESWNVQKSNYPWSSLAVDWSFLMRNKNDSRLYQMRRAGEGPELSSRELALQGGNAITKEFSESTRVITSPESQYIYLFDTVNQSFVVYRSLPLKNKETVNSTYKLQYFYSFKFALWESLVKDVFIRDGEKPLAYFLTNSGIVEVRLFDYIEQYSQVKQ